jgi:hypothetical protein
MQFTMICPRLYHQKIAASSPETSQNQGQKMHLNQETNHNSPQLTTKPEVQSFPQPSGPSSAIDFEPFQKARKGEYRKFQQRNPPLSVHPFYPC